MGILLILSSAALIAVNPLKGGKLPSGFFNPAVAFEFLKTEPEIYDLLGHDTPAAPGGFIQSMETGLYVDFVYMCVYTIFLLMFAGVCRRMSDSGWYILSMCVVLCIYRADFGENIQLLTIIKNLDAGGFSEELGQLYTFTWAKWGGFSAFFISLIPYLSKAGIFGKIISVTALLSALTGLAAFLNRSILNEIYVLSIGTIFVMLVIFCFTFTVSLQSK